MVKIAHLYVMSILAQFLKKDGEGSSKNKGVKEGKEAECRMCSRKGRLTDRVGT